MREGECVIIITLRSLFARDCHCTFIREMLILDYPGIIGVSEPYLGRVPQEEKNIYKQNIKDLESEHVKGEV